MPTRRPGRKSRPQQPFKRFSEVVTEAVADFTENGFVSAEQLEYWLGELRAAAMAQMTPDKKMQEALVKVLRTAYAGFNRPGVIERNHPSVSRFTIQQIEPKLRGELDRRILASANLIKLNRQQAIEETLRRFSGWATSIPAGGSDNVERNPVKSDIRKSMASLPFRERRVLIDQGHKLNSSLNNVVATSGGAIAVIWHSHWRQAHYNYRKDHKERDEKVYALRDNWALQNGLMKPGPAGYYDEVTAFGEEVFCRCYGQYIYALRKLPLEMLTIKGAEMLAQARAALNEQMQKVA